ncbi:MAG: hypothetical protein WCG20_00185 [bacterium]
MSEERMKLLLEKADTGIISPEEELELLEELNKGLEALQKIVDQMPDAEPGAVIE